MVTIYVSMLLALPVSAKNSMVCGLLPVQLTIWMLCGRLVSL